MQARAKENLKVRRRRRRTSVIAMILALLLLLTGTFAWQSISQQALNEAMGMQRPAGGRLHDDFEVIGERYGMLQWRQGLTANKDVYVENFENADEEDPVVGLGRPIFVRVRTYEYMELGEGARILPGEDNYESRLASYTGPEGPTGTVVPIVPGTNRDDWTTWVPRVPAHMECERSEEFQSIWTWSRGGQKYYMPTFNRDPFSLMTDVKGHAVDPQHADLVTAGEPANPTRSIANGGTSPAAFPAAEVAGVDAGLHDFFEGATPVTHTAPMKYWDPALNSGLGGHAVTTTPVTHTAQQTLGSAATPANDVMYMRDWLALPQAERPVGNFWVLDDDGWAYWAAPLQPQTATALLINSITLAQRPVQEWYYGIHIDAQMATAEEWHRSAPGYGWYADVEREPSTAATGLMNIVTGVSANPAAGIAVGSTFTDSNNVLWRVLYRDEQDRMLIITERVHGMVGATGVAYNTATNAYVRLHQSNIRTRLNDWWDDHLATELRHRALPAHGLLTDVRSAFNVPIAWAVGENQPAGHTAPSAGLATSDNSMFILSLSEANRYFANNAARAAFDANAITTTRAWWLRSPGSSATLTVAQVPATAGGGAIVGLNATTATPGFRPAMWISLDTNLTISGPTITTGPLSGGVVNTAYSAALTASGPGEITWNVQAGTLPAGLTLSAAGVISGTPTTVGTSNFTVRARNAGGTTTANLSIVIGPAVPQIATTTLPGATVDVAYSATLAAGAAPYNVVDEWTVSVGDLPAGLVLNATTGAITGTPEGPPGDANFTVQATNATGSATQALTITVTPP